MAGSISRHTGCDWLGGRGRDPWSAASLARPTDRASSCLLAVPRPRRRPRSGGGLRAVCGWAFETGTRLVVAGF